MADWLNRLTGRRSDTPPVVSLGGREVPVVIRRLERARRMTLRLAPDGGEVRLSMPRWARNADAIAFVSRQQGWLEAQASALPARDPPGPGGSLPYRGEPHAIVHAPSAPRKVVIDAATIRIGGPAETLAPRLRRWLEAEARETLRSDIAHYCALAKRTPPALALSNAQRRWGSCAASGAIRINWRLIMAPEPVRRSVVAHEVAHLVHFDHSPRFHAVLAELFEGDVGAANRWLRTHGRSLYAPFG
jgi:predicted metal-dependent hydrolase